MSYLSQNARLVGGALSQARTAWSLHKENVARDSASVGSAANALALERKMIWIWS
jgi:hypothetical protein